MIFAKILIIAAFTLVPVYLVGREIYNRDIYEKEPLKVIFLIFAGGLFSVIPAVIVEYGLTPSLCNFKAYGFYIMGYFFNGLPIDYLKEFFALSCFGLYAIIIIGPVEESVKFLVVYFLARPSKELNEPMDGIVYGAFAGLGFATVENILYAFGADNVALSIFNLVLRSIICLPLHSILGGICGYYIGLYKLRKRVSLKILFKGLAISALFHGLYDAILFVLPNFGFLILASGFYGNTFFLLVTGVLTIYLTISVLRGSYYCLNKLVEEALHNSPFRFRFRYLYNDDDDLKYSVESIKCGICRRISIDPVAFCSECGQSLLFGTRDCHQCGISLSAELEICPECDIQQFSDYLDFRTKKIPRKRRVYSVTQENTLTTN